MLELIVCGERRKGADLRASLRQSAGGLPVWAERLPMLKANGTSSPLTKRLLRGEKAGQLHIRYAGVIEQRV